MKSLIIAILLGFGTLSFQAFAAEKTCDYKVQKGEWVAKILRDLGSKNPFKDQSYYKTLKLNKENKSIHKLVTGDTIKLPQQFCNRLNTVAVGSKVSKVKKTNVVKPKPVVENKVQRVPASVAPSHKTHFVKSHSNIKTSTNDDSFPILEYDAILPSGGAK